MERLMTMFNVAILIAALITLTKAVFGERQLRNFIVFFIEIIVFALGNIFLGANL